MWKIVCVFVLILGVCGIAEACLGSKLSSRRENRQSMRASRGACGMSSMSSSMTTTVRYSSRGSSRQMMMLVPMQSGCAAPEAIAAPKK